MYNRKKGRAKANNADTSPKCNLQSNVKCPLESSSEAETPSDTPESEIADVNTEEPLTQLSTENSLQQLSTEQSQTVTISSSDSSAAGSDTVAEETHVRSTAVMLYEGFSLTTECRLMLFNSYVCHHNLTQQGCQDLLKLLRLCLPKENTMPSSLYLYHITFKKLQLLLQHYKSVFLKYFATHTAHPLLKLKCFVILAM